MRNLKMLSAELTLATNAVVDEYYGHGCQNPSNFQGAVEALLGVATELAEWEEPKETAAGPLQSRLQTAKRINERLRIKHDVETSKRRVQKFKGKDIL